MCVTRRALAGDSGLCRVAIFEVSYGQAAFRDKAGSLGTDRQRRVHLTVVALLEPDALRRASMDREPDTSNGSGSELLPGPARENP